MEHKDQFEQFSDKVSSEQADVQETADNENSAQTADNESAELQKLESEIQELKDKYLRQAAEFDNFRKRNAKERLELMQTAGKEVITDLLEVLEDRYGKSSTVVTSQLPVAKWHEWIADATAADAILDRLVHNAYKIELKGPSRRKEKNN